MSKHERRPPPDNIVLQMSDEAQSQKQKETPKDEQSSILWKHLFITSCVIAVLFDPLFFYIPYISEVRKCIGRDDRVQKAALISRSITDVGYLVHMIYHLQVAVRFALSMVAKEKLELDGRLGFRQRVITFAKAFSHRLSWLYFFTDVLSILPLPQVLMVGSFFKIDGNHYLLKRKVVSGFLLIQYLPRTYRIYLSYPRATESELWVRGLFNFFLYILASHVLGAFWYFFSIQRETACWYQSCVATHLVDANCTFFCHGNIATPLITPQFNKILDEQCVLKVPYNMTDPPFDFGIFFDLLKNDIQGRINVAQKIGFCFWWGLRNMSNFGTSLVTSTNLWENVFAILISVIGLLLFLYLIGNVQIYIEKATTNMETRAEKAKVMLKRKRNDIMKWMENFDLDDDMQQEIWYNIKVKLEGDQTIDLDDIYSLLPIYTKRSLKRSIGMKMLKNIQNIRMVDGRILKMMCDKMKLVKYEKDYVILTMGKPLDRIVFIIDGSISKNTNDHIHSTGGDGSEATTTNTTRISSVKYKSAKGESYGHELLEHAASRTPKLLNSSETVVCHTKVEALVLMATDLRTIATQAPLLWQFIAFSQNDQVIPPRQPTSPQERQGLGKRTRTK